MKKLLNIALLCITPIAFSQANKVINDSNKTTAINTELKFGKYSDCFRSGGICTFNTNANKVDSNTLVIHNFNNTITLIIDRSKITKHEELKILGQELMPKSKIDNLKFEMEESFILDASIKSNLKIAKPLTKIKTGSYPIIITAETFTITVNLE